MRVRNGQRFDLSFIRKDSLTHKALTKRFGTNINEIHDILLNNPNFRIALNSMTFDYTKYSIGIHANGLEKWDYPSKENDYGNKSEEKQQYDVEGHRYADVYAEVTLNLFDKEQRDIYIQNLSHTMTLLWESTQILVKGLLKPLFRKKFRLVSKKYYKPLSGLKTYFHILKQIPKAFSRKTSRYIWQIDTHENFMNSALEEIAYSRIEYKLPPKLLNEQLEMEIENVKSEIERYPKDLLMGVFGYDRIDNAMWIRKDDPTVIVVDTEGYQKELKDGLSNKDVKNIVEKWLKLILGYNAIRVKSTEAIASKSLDLDLKVSLLEMEMGEVYEIKSVSDLYALLGIKNGKDERDRE
jgi:hypothetical protein